MITPYLESLFSALNIPRMEALVILELTPTPNMILPLFASSICM